MGLPTGIAAACKRIVTPTGIPHGGHQQSGRDVLESRSSIVRVRHRLAPIIGLPSPTKSRRAGQESYDARCADCCIYDFGSDDATPEKVGFCYKWTHTARHVGSAFIH